MEPADKETTLYHVLNQPPHDVDTMKQQAHLTRVLLDTLTEALPQYVFWKDRHSVYLGCNRNFAELVGLSSTESIVGKTDDDLDWQATGHTAETFRAGDQATITGSAITNQEEILVLPDGQRLVTWVCKRPIIDQGQVIGVIGYFTDISVLKAKEAALEEAKTQAEAANRAKTAFLQHISHSLRTPLSGMVSVDAILAKEINSEHGRLLIEGMQSAHKALLDIVEQTIECVRLTAQSNRRKQCKFSLKDTLEGALALIQPAVLEKQLHCHLHYDEAIPDYLMGDPFTLQGLLLNLLSNAVKFTAQGGIDVYATLAQPTERDVIITLSFKDTGMGIPEDKLSMIFERFNRAQPVYRGIYPGFGLGLSIVQGAIDVLGGELHVESTLKKGTTFTCVLPFKKALLQNAEQAITTERIHAATPYTPPECKPADQFALTARAASSGDTA